MEVQINYWALLISATASFLVGVLRHEPLFGRGWMQEMPAFWR